MDMLYVKGARKNLVSVGWENGTLQCEFKGNRRYRFMSVERQIYDTILRVPFPDSYFCKKVTGQYVSERVA